MFGVYDLSISIIALIVSKNRVMIITASRCYQFSRAVTVLCGVYRMYDRRQLGARTRGIGQKITKKMSFSDTLSDTSVSEAANLE